MMRKSFAMRKELLLKNMNIKVRIVKILVWYKAPYISDTQTLGIEEKG